MKKQKRFLAKAVKKVSLVGVDLKFNKEFLIRRLFGTYFTLDKDKIRYTIYNLAKGNYAIVGKCLAKKTKNFQLAEVKTDNMQEFLPSFIQDNFPDRNIFVSFLKKEYGVEL